MRETNPLRNWSRENSQPSLGSCPLGKRHKFTNGECGCGAVKERFHGLLFMPEMVRACLNSQPGVWPAQPVNSSAAYKWQTRRLFSPGHCLVDGHRVHSKSPIWRGLDFSKARLEPAGPITGWNTGPYLHAPWTTEGTERRVYPAFTEGDEWYGKETFCMSFNEALKAWEPLYRADGKVVYDEDGPAKWKPSIFMRKEHSRIRGTIKRVRVERLQDISDEDAEAEGVSITDVVVGIYHKNEPWRDTYKKLWNSINGEAENWDSNPWVMVLDLAREAT